MNEHFFRIVGTTNKSFSYFCRSNKYQMSAFCSVDNFVNKIIAKNLVILKSASKNSSSSSDSLRAVLSSKK